MSEADATIRRAVPGDEHRLAMLGSATFLTAFARDHPGDALVAHCTGEHGATAYAAWLADPAYALWIAETAKAAPVAYAMLSPPQVEVEIEDDALELKRIYTLAGWQGAGLGHDLMNGAIAEAKARGASALYLCVYETNVAAHRFYGRHGFEKMGEQDFMVGEAPFTDWILRREL